MFPRWNDDDFESPLQLIAVEPFDHPGLEEYADEWRRLVYSGLGKVLK